MEELGLARRGWFVTGLSGAWFGLPGAVEQLRALRSAQGVTYALTATDPAQAWGAVIPWPEAAQGAMKREAGAWVALCDGEPRLWLGRGGHSLVVYPATATAEELAPAVSALCGAIEAAGEPAQPLRRINGAEEIPGALREALLGAGLLADRAGGIGPLRLPVRL
jgi:ATP-dependent Lhr-like helicase